MRGQRFFAAVFFTAGFFAAVFFTAFFAVGFAERSTFGFAILSTSSGLVRRQAAR